MVIIDEWNENSTKSTVNVQTEEVIDEWYGVSSSYVANC
jgi:hypothetical protein